MGGLSFAEILTILVVILIVFGPHRLPELARKLGSLIARARESAAALTRQLESEYGEAAAPIRELKIQLDGARQDISDAVAGLAGADDPAPPGSTGGEPDSGEAARGTDDEVA